MLQVGPRCGKKIEHVHTNTDTCEVWRFLFTYLGDFYLFFVCYYLFVCFLTEALRIPVVLSLNRRGALNGLCLLHL